MPSQSLYFPWQVHITVVFFSYSTSVFFSFVFFQNYLISMLKGNFVNEILLGKLWRMTELLLLSRYVWLFGCLRCPFFFSLFAVILLGFWSFVCIGFIICLINCVFQWQLRAILPQSKFAREYFAIFTTIFFAWLVGPCEVRRTKYSSLYYVNLFIISTFFFHFWI